MSVIEHLAEIANLVYLPIAFGNRVLGERKKTLNQRFHQQKYYCITLKTRV